VLVERNVVKATPISNARATLGRAACADIL
jgi:hypothetical protein